MYRILHQNLYRWVGRLASHYLSLRGWRIGTKVLDAIGIRQGSNLTRRTNMRKHFKLSGCLSSSKVTRLEMKVTPIVSNRINNVKTSA